MPGITLANKTIVGAGAVVTKSVLEEGQIVESILMFFDIIDQRYNKEGPNTVFFRPTWSISPNANKVIYSNRMITKI